MSWLETVEGNGRWRRFSRRRFVALIGRDAECIEFGTVRFVHRYGFDDGHLIDTTIFALIDGSGGWGHGKEVFLFVYVDSSELIVFDM